MLHSLFLAVALTVVIPPANDTGVVDQAGLLSQSEAQDLGSFFHDVQVNQGVHLGLLTLSNMDDDIQAVARRTVNFWQMSPDSVLMVVSLNPKQIRLEPGSNLRYQFSQNVSVNLIRDNVVPAMKAGRYGAGILNGFHAISRRLPGQYATTVPTPNTRQRTVVTAPAPVPVHTDTSAVADEPSGGHPVLWFFLIVGGVFVVALLIRRAMQRQRDLEYEETLAARDYQTNFAINSARYRNSPVVPTGGGLPTSAPAGGTTVINNNTGGGNGSGFVTGMLVGEALSRPSYTPPVFDPRPAIQPDAQYVKAPSQPSGGTVSFDDDTPSAPAGGTVDFDSSNGATASGGSASWGSSSDNDSGSSGGSSSWGSSSSDDDDSGSSDGGGSFDFGGGSDDSGSSGGGDSSW